jgi:RHS repeat-associated protein
VSSPTTSYSYDAAGNTLTRHDPAGVTTTKVYTPLNQLASFGYSGSSAHSVSYVYDANGNRVSMVDGTGTSTYIYDVFDELSSYQNGAGKIVSYSYDADGNTTGITYPLGAGATWASTTTAGYGYDNADELNSVTDFNNHTITIGDTADGLPTSLTLGSSGDTLTTTYDPTDTPSDITLANSTPTTFQEFNFSDVPSGAVSSETDTPSRTATYNYDAQNRVTSMTSPTETYGPDASGNLTTLPTGTSSTNYDNASELTASTLSGTTTTYIYNADGEQTQRTAGGTTTVSAIYNGAREMTSYANTAANMSTAAYDGDGLRQTETSTPTGGTATPQNFTWDVSEPIPLPLMDSTNAYIYGPNYTPIEQVNLSTGTIEYLVSDRLGSVRGIVSATGTLTATTNYDAWGNPQTTGGLTSYTPIGYAGAYTDPTGVLYLINRYYDPTTGQFTSVDPAVDQTETPYAYVNGDPVEKTDPLGLGVSSWLSGAVSGAVNDMFAVDSAIGDSIGNAIGTSSLARPFLSVGNDIGSSLGSAYYGFASAHPCIAETISAGVQIAGVVIAPEEVGPEELGAAGFGNLTAGVLGDDAILRSAEEWLGPGYREIAPGVYRSADGARQFRMVDSSDLGASSPHVHFEAIGPDGREILENGHVYLLPK